MTDLLTRELGVGVETLVDAGMVWALNEHVLHGQGYELRASGERLWIAGAGRAVLAWPEGSEDAVDRRWRQFRQTLLDAQKYNNPAFWEEQSKANVRGGARR